MHEIGLPINLKIDTMKNLMLGLLSCVFLFASCSNDDDNGNNNTDSNLTLNLTGLEDLGSDFAYEGWIIVDGVPISTGTFTVDSSGTLSTSSFTVDTTALAAATKFVLSVEPNPDPDPLPSDQKMLAGDFDGDSATVNTSTEPAVGDYSNAAGTFFLRTPTDEPAGSANNGNDQYGVWFGLPGVPPTSNLTLPTLPSGWTYEGWVIGDSGPLSTGKFLNFDEFDDNAGAATSFGGTEQLGPTLPGEDFFNNAPGGETFPLDIRGRTIVISIEPVPDNSSAPFVLKPLSAAAGNDTAPASYPFSLNLNSFPEGTVSR